MDKPRLYVDGQWRAGHGARFESHDPSRGALVWSGASADTSDVDTAFAAARRAAEAWALRPFAERDNTNIVSWTEHPEGGHFASMEVPAELASAIRVFYARS